MDVNAGAPNNSAVRACASAAARTAISQRRCGEGCEQIYTRVAGGPLGKPSTSNRPAETGKKFRVSWDGLAPNVGARVGSSHDQ
jgi:hypothetical protein